MIWGDHRVPTHQPFVSLIKRNLTSQWWVGGGENVFLCGMCLVSSVISLTPTHSLVLIISTPACQPDVPHHFHSIAHSDSSLHLSNWTYLWTALRYYGSLQPWCTDETMEVLNLNNILATPKISPLQIWTFDWRYGPSWTWNIGSILDKLSGESFPTFCPFHINSVSTTNVEIIQLGLGMSNSTPKSLTSPVTVSLHSQRTFRRRFLKHNNKSLIQHLKIIAILCNYILRTLHFPL